jgi:glycosyltransferase involved in cell wall biosynthesis
MLIGIFSKMGASGGSEHRVAELANGIVRHSANRCVILCERELSSIIEQKLAPTVQVAKNVLGERGVNKEIFYKVDSLLIVNSDSYSFSKLDYWEGRTEHHRFFIDVAKLKQMIFLYNFVISPSTKLATLLTKVKDVRVICANQKFFQKITDENKFRTIRHLPRIVLDSPIDPASITHQKVPSGRIRIGKHSKAYGYKFNEEHKRLITEINNKYGEDKLLWDFMGVPGDRAKELKQFQNVILRREFSKPVRDYLTEIDIFLFFIDWGRNEPWSRAVAEGLMAGCPVIATNKAGNKDQIVHGNNGYLCNNYEEIYASLCVLIEKPIFARRLGMNGHIYSRQFTLSNVIKRFLDFITAPI